MKNKALYGLFVVLWVLGGLNWGAAKTQGQTGPTAVHVFYSPT